MPAAFLEDHVAKTARLLGIQRNTLLRKIVHLNVSLEGVPNRRGRK